LFESLNQQFEQTIAQSVDTEFEQTRDRQTQRTVSVLDQVDGIGNRRLVCVKGNEMRSNELSPLRHGQQTDGNPSRITG
jgi:hypothetical protein